MPAGTWTVVDCGACGSLHPVFWDGYAGIDGDHVYDCPVVGRKELGECTLRTVVSVEPEQGQ